MKRAIDITYLGMKTSVEVLLQAFQYNIHPCNESESHIVGDQYGFVDWIGM